MFEFGCSGGMNLLHLISALSRYSYNVDSAIGTDFSPVLIEAGNKKAESYLNSHEQRHVQFCVAKNETLFDNLLAALGEERLVLQNSFHLVGVNTMCYCHRTSKQMGCALDIFRLLILGGACVVIDVNDGFPGICSKLNNVPRTGEK